MVGQTKNAALEVTKCGLDIDQVSDGLADLHRKKLGSKFSAKEELKRKLKPSGGFSPAMKHSKSGNSLTYITSFWASFP
jgi:hypothetical protein